MASSERAHILAVVAEKAKDAAALDPSLVIEEAASVEEAAARLRRQPRPELIVVGSAVNAGLAGDHLLEADGETSLLFMIRPDRLARFQAGLPFMRVFTAPGPRRTTSLPPIYARSCSMPSLQRGAGAGGGRTKWTSPL